MKKNKIKNIAGLIVLFIILSSCDAYKSVDIGDIENVNFKGMVDNKISLELQVPVTNPNGYKIKIKSMDLDVTINGSYLGKLKNSSEIIIPAKSDEVHNFLVDIYVKNALSSIASMYKLRKAKNLEMQIEGTIKVKALLNSKTIKVSEKQDVSI
ncbi:MAG: LEA type 2 family protein [Bacteroidales bacterium]|nr:LEA type 2 family protein [Bacteroidales bacterium]